MADKTESLDGDGHYPVTANVPVEITNPQRKAKLIAVAWIVALVMCTVAGAYVAATFAVERNDQARRQLQAEINRRTAQRDAQNAALRAAIEQYREDQCTVTALLPQTPAVVDVRARYRCTNAVTPSSLTTPSPAPEPGPDGAPRSAERRPGGAASTPRTSTRPPPGGPPPTPAPAPDPPVTPPPAGLCLPLPLTSICLESS